MEKYTAKTIDLFRSPISLSSALAVIDLALASGASIEDLRWRASRAQRTALITLEFMVSNGSNDVNQRLHTGAWDRSAHLYGIPVKVDDSLKDDVLILEIVEPKEVAVKVENLSKPFGY